MPDDLSDDIRDNAVAPRRAAADGVQSEQHSLPDQIAADKYLRSQDATRTRTRGLKFSKFKPPGTV